MSIEQGLLTVAFVLFVFALGLVMGWSYHRDSQGVRDDREFHYQKGFREGIDHAKHAFIAQYGDRIK